MRYINLIGCALGIVLLLPGFVAGAGNDNDQPIHLEADSLDVDDVRGVSIYRGNVSYVQGRRSLAADEVTLYSVEHTRVDKVVALGKPATFRHQPDPPGELVRGEAFHIEYYAQEDRLLFQGNAHLWQGESEFTGNRIEYDANAETVKASKGADGGERVQVIIQPRKEVKDIPPAANPMPRPAP